jgi:hypothetical protein
VLKKLEGTLPEEISFLDSVSQAPTGEFNLFWTYVTARAERVAGEAPSGDKWADASALVLDVLAL